MLALIFYQHCTFIKKKILFVKRVKRDKRIEKMIESKFQKVVHELIGLANTTLANNYVFNALIIIF